jgi:hypothetical protein
MPYAAISLDRSAKRFIIRKADGGILRSLFEIHGDAALVDFEVWWGVV